MCFSVVYGVCTCAQVHVPIQTRVRMPEAHIRCPASHRTWSWAGGQQVPKIVLSPLPTELGFPVHTAVPGFYMGTGIWTPLLLVCEQLARFPTKPSLQPLN